MIREKKELVDSLKARDYIVGQIVIATGKIVGMKDVVTKFNKDGENSTIVTIENQSNDIINNVFINNESMNNLIDAYGVDDLMYIGKLVKVVCNDSNHFKAKQLVIVPII